MKIKKTKKKKKKKKKKLSERNFLHKLPCKIQLFGLFQTSRPNPALLRSSSYFLPFSNPYLRLEVKTAGSASASGFGSASASASGLASASASASGFGSADGKAFDKPSIMVLKGLSINYYLLSITKKTG